MGSACGTRGRTVCMVLVGQPERKRHFGRSIWEDILKWILRKEYEGMNWICLAQDDTEGTVIVQNIADYSLTQ